MKRIISLALASVLTLAGLVIAQPASGAIIEWDLRAKPVPTGAKGTKLIAPKKITKNAPPRTGGVSTLAGTPLFYAGGAQNDVNLISPAVTAVIANFSLFNTSAGNSGYLDTANDSHTLVELAVRKTNNSNAGLVEAIITKDPNVCGDSQPRLAFFYWDKNGTSGGYNTNLNLYSGRTMNPCDLVTGTISMAWVYDAPTQRWWAQIAGNYVGWYDNSVFGSSFTFDRAGQVLAFGEVAQYPAGTRTFTCSDMGNGQTPSATAGASLISSTSYNGSGTNVNLTKITPSTGFDSYHVNGRSFRYGGVGTNSTGGLPGNLGSC